MDACCACSSSTGEVSCADLFSDFPEMSMPVLSEVSNISQVQTQAPASPNNERFDVPMEIHEKPSLMRKTRKALRDEANGIRPQSTYGPIKKPREKNKQKHNESEARRRSRLRDKFFELRDAAHVNKKDRFN